jgi:hypothetical protein
MKKMPEQTAIVWDLETVPDLAAAARMLDLGNASVASRQPEGWRIDALGAPHIGERSEAKLIGDFIEKIGQLLSQLITFNGHRFDLPVIRYRAAKGGNTELDM